MATAKSTEPTAAEPTPPSGQGGKTPKDRPDHQDMFPPNPEPSESAKAWGERVDAVGPVQAHSDAIAEEAGAAPASEPPPASE